MDKRTLELLKLTEKLRKYSDNDVQVIRTKPLAEILDSIESEQLPDNVIQISEKKKVKL